MNFPRFFINRPIFAIVLSVLMLIAGALAFLQLPLSEYPSVTPPTVQVTASYPGANPQVIADTVASPLEQAVNGVEGMLYMNSQMATDGRMVLTISFKQGTDPDMAQIQVQNRVSRALPRLPQEVQRIGVVTQKTSPDVLMVVHLVSPGKRYDPLYLSNFAIRQVRDELARLPGVGDVLVWGAGEYSMRVWLDPARVAARGLTASEVVAAIREQNVQVAAGSVGQQPDASAAFQVTVNTLGRLTSEEQFGDIIVKTGAEGQVTRLRDVARVSMGADSYALRSLLNGEPALALWRAQGSVLVGQCHCRQADGQVQPDPGWLRRHLSAAARAGPGGDGRLQAPDRGQGGAGRPGPGAGARPDHGQGHAGAGAGEHAGELSNQCASAAGGH